jgi:hypothetical protein
MLVMVVAPTIGNAVARLHDSHSEIADHFFVLDGDLTVETRAPDDYRPLGIGERYQINAGHALGVTQKSWRFLFIVPGFTFRASLRS